MYDKEKNRSDSRNCPGGGHSWPGTRGMSTSGLGTVTHERCNCCLAVRITWRSDELVDGAWVSVSDERVVEPDLRP